jgi:predicted transposase YbfD/YdcC
MKTLEDIALVEHFSEIEDTRDRCGRRHDLHAMIVIAVCAVLCGVNSIEGIADFAECRLKWFKKFFDMPHGHPSADTFTRVFALIQPDAFERCFMSWVQSIKKFSDGDTIAIDGKTLRGSFDTKNNLGPLHLVQAFAVRAGLVLLQKEVNNKTNEITAIPELLESLILKGTVVTIDAMGCQKKIAKQIIDSEADYALALKGNQGDFHRDVEAFLTKLIKNEIKRDHDYYKLEEANNHGRNEIRECYAVEITKVDIKEKLFANIMDWEKLTTVAAVCTQRTNKTTGEVSLETRFYISSLEANAKEILTRTREHWGIENSLHYVLDVTFQEDKSRVRKINATKNFALIRKVALNIIKSSPFKQKKKVSSLAGVRRFACFNEDFLEELILTS